MPPEPDHDATPIERVQRRVEARATLPGGAESLLLVDDEPLVLRVNASELRRLGYAVTCAACGEEALAHLQERRFDLVVLDLIMPDMDGVETFRAILRIRPDQKALVYSGYAEPKKATDIQRLGAWPILLKPTPIAELAVAIRARLDGAIRGH